MAALRKNNNNLETADLPGADFTLDRLFIVDTCSFVMPPYA